MSFSGDMERLRAIIGEFETHDLSMEDSLSLFEEGVRLVKDCREYLDTTKRRVTELSGGQEVELETDMIEERKQVDE